jgi:predicted molibdopterin-dependent oxidoreductase YjgC
VINVRKQRDSPYIRLTQPLVRENGELRPADWDEALDRAAEGFRRAVAGKGPDAVGMFSCSKSTNEMNFVAQKFMRTAIGSNNIDSCNRT